MPRPFKLCEFKTPAEANQSLFVLKADAASEDDYFQKLKFHVEGTVVFATEDHLDQLTDGKKKKLKALAAKGPERIQALERLKKVLSKGKTIYTVVTGRRQGLVDKCKVFISHKGEVQDIGASISEALGYEWLDDGSLNVGYPFNIVFKLSDKLYGEGYVLKHKSL